MKETVASADTWAKIGEDKTGMEGMIATAVASNVYSYDHADLVPASASFHNRIRYILASKDDDKTKIAGVGAVFGRLG